MKSTTIFGLIALLALAAAGAGEAGDRVSPTVYVDVDRIVDANEVQPVDGLSAAGQPGADTLKVFADAGYVAVIDMRGAAEDRGMDDEESVVEDLGLDYVTFPIESRDEINFDKARELDELLQSYDGPVLLHCASGNRVGAVLALRESLHGADDATALEYGRDAGLTRLEGVVRERLQEK